MGIQEKCASKSCSLILKTGNSIIIKKLDFHWLVIDQSDSSIYRWLDLRTVIIASGTFWLTLSVRNSGFLTTTENTEIWLAGTTDLLIFYTGL